MRRNRPDTHWEQFLLYTLIGGSGTLVHYTLFALLSNIHAGVNPAGFAAAGALAGAVVNYTLNRCVTFSSRRRHIAAFPQFMLLTGANMFLSSIVVNIFTLGGMHYLFGQILATSIYLPLGYWISRRVIFA